MSLYQLRGLNTILQEISRICEEKKSIFRLHGLTPWFEEFLTTLLRTEHELFAQSERKYTKHYNRIIEQFLNLKEITENEASKGGH